MGRNGWILVGQVLWGGCQNDFVWNFQNQVFIIESENLIMEAARGFYTRACLGVLVISTWIDGWIISQKRIISHDHGVSCCVRAVSPRNLKPQTHLCAAGILWALALEPPHFRGNLISISFIMWARLKIRYTPQIAYLQANLYHWPTLS